MTEIQWTDETWNPVRGCSRVSPGCDRCYAMHQARRFDVDGGPYEGLTRIGKRGVDWSGQVRLVPEMLDRPLRWRKPRRVFVNSMSDLFHESLDFEEIAAVFGAMAASPHHTFQVLTKRPRRMLEWFQWLTRLETDPWTECHHFALLRDGDDQVIHRRSGSAPGRPWPLPNVWLGVSAENQATADERIPLLRKCPAAVRWVSAEPLLGPLDLSAFVYNRDAEIRKAMNSPMACNWDQADAVIPESLSWVVVGGESGHGARICDVAWIRSVVEQCKAAKVPCFVKQLGAHPTVGDGDEGGPVFLRGVTHAKGGDPAEWPEGLRVREWPEVSP